MTKINLDELIADREAGTPGVWQADSFMCDDDRILRVAMPNTVSGMETATITFCEANWRDYGSGERRISFIEAQSNARRIARLPDLEAAYLEAVELLEQVAEGHALHSDITDFLEK